MLMRYIFILQNISMPRTVAHVNRIHEPVLHVNGQPADRVSQHSAANEIKGAILDHGNPFAVEGDSTT